MNRARNGTRSMPSLYNLLEASWSRRIHRCTPIHTSRGACVVSGKTEELSSTGSVTSDTQGPYTTELKSRGVISLEGPDIFKFLHGLVTNDVTRLENFQSGTSVSAAAPLLYAALLNPQGRFLYDLFLYRPTHSIREGNFEGPVLLADVDSSVLDEIVSHLNRHRLRAKVKIDNISNELEVWQKFSVGSDNDARVKMLKASTDESSCKDWRWYQDPRLTELGLRGVFPSNSCTQLDSAHSVKKVDEEYYLLWRLEQGIAEGSIEIPKGEAIPLEYNLAGLNAISFEKGCYIGQELIARTHHRGVIRKRVLPVKFVDEEGKEAHQVVQGVEIVDVISKKKVGKVNAVVGSCGLALLRLDAAFKETSRLKLDTPLNEVYVKVRRPNWWSGQWGNEEHQEAVVNA